MNTDSLLPGPEVAGFSVGIVVDRDVRVSLGIPRSAGLGKPILVEPVRDALTIEEARDLGLLLIAAAYKAEERRLKRLDRRLPGGPRP